MTKNIEVEIRGPLSTDEYTHLKGFLEKNGTPKGSKKRLLIDYSTCLEKSMEDRSTDIRLRITNGKPELIVKLGGWGANEQRKELSVFTEGKSFDTLVAIFAAMGYGRGMVCVRNTAVYDYQGVEFALVEVPGHSYYYEAEKMASSDEDGNLLIQEVVRLCTELKLGIFTKEQFFGYIRELNESVNFVFDASKESESFFQEKFPEYM